MRSLTDLTGLTISLETVHGEDAYAGMTEGTPYLARKFRLLQGREHSKRPGWFVHGLNELEREITMLPRDTETWAPRERWMAKLVGQTDWNRKVKQFLFVTWYQEGGDPMSHLGEIIRGLDFRCHCHEEPIELD